MKWNWKNKTRNINWKFVDRSCQWIVERKKQISINIHVIEIEISKNEKRLLKNPFWMICIDFNMNSLTTCLMTRMHTKNSLNDIVIKILYQWIMKKSRLRSQRSNILYLKILIVIMYSNFVRLSMFQRVQK